MYLDHLGNASTAPTCTGFEFREKMPTRVLVFAFIEIFSPPNIASSYYRSARPSAKEIARKQFLESEPLLRKVRPHYVVCYVCDAKKRLSQRQRYDVWPWLKHRKRIHDDLGRAWVAPIMVAYQRPPSLSSSSDGESDNVRVIIMYLST